MRKAVTYPPIRATHNVAENSHVCILFNPNTTTMDAHLIRVVGKEAALEIPDQISPSALRARSLELARLHRMPGLVMRDHDPTQPRGWGAT